MKDVKRVTRVFVIFLVLIFGQGSWIGINSIWVELPVLVALGIPEQFEIASWLVIIIQVANIGPLLFALINFVTPKGFQLEGPTNYIISALGTIVCLLLVFFWDIFTIWDLDMKRHSTLLMVLTFLLAIINCTSNVTFIPFMSRLKSNYMTWFFIGMGLSGMIPSFVALIQGVGGSPICIANFTYMYMANESDGTLFQCTEWMYKSDPARFGPEPFFGFLTLMMFLCFLSYVSLNHLSIVKEEYAPEYLEKQQHHEDDQAGGEYEMVSKYADDPSEKTEAHIIPDEGQQRTKFVVIFLVLGLTNALINSMLPSIQSFSAGAYGLKIYLLAATFASIANPVACFIVMVKPSKNLKVVYMVFALGAVVGIYCFVTALTSPTPPLQDHAMGSILVVLAWTVASGSFHYVRATIGWILRTEPNNRVLLISYGIVNQVGSLFGAIVIFPLVNYTDWFVPYYPDPCANQPECVEISRPIATTAL